MNAHTPLNEFVSFLTIDQSKSFDFPEETHKNLIVFKDDHLNSSLNKEILTLFHIFLSNKIEFKVN